MSSEEPKSMSIIEALKRPSAELKMSTGVKTTVPESVLLTLKACHQATQAQFPVVSSLPGYEQNAHIIEDVRSSLSSSFLALCQKVPNLMKRPKKMAAMYAKLLRTHNAGNCFEYACMANEQLPKAFAANIISIKDNKNPDYNHTLLSLQLDTSANVFFDPFLGKVYLANEVTTQATVCYHKPGASKVVYKAYDEQRHSIEGDVFEAYLDEFKEILQQSSGPSGP